MATYEFKVYNWTGNGGYNTQYNTSHTATVTDNDARYEGDEDMDEVVCIDGAECSTSEGEPYSINISFTDTDGNDHVELFHFMNVDNQWYFAPGTDSAFTEGAILGDYQSHTTGWNYGQVTCFVAGTMIATPEGEVPVETLSAGDFVSDDTGQALEVAQVMRRQIGPLELARGPGLRPICISQGALGKGLPETDLSVSRQHRILLRAPGANGIAGQADCLVAACRLLALPGRLLPYRGAPPRDFAGQRRTGRKLLSRPTSAALNASRRPRRAARHLRASRNRGRYRAVCQNLPGQARAKTAGGRTRLGHALTGRPEACLPAIG